MSAEFPQVAPETDADRIAEEVRQLRDALGFLVLGVGASWFVVYSQWYRVAAVIFFVVAASLAATARR